jgi:hypothetical protein
LLRELKDRSGLSYGALSKRLHTSTSTLHRYCSGVAVPADYAPVERFARACRATPEELVELHRRWVLADAARGTKEADRAAPQAPGAGAPGASGVRSAPPVAGAADAPDATDATDATDTGAVRDAGGSRGSRDAAGDHPPAAETPASPASPASSASSVSPHHPAPGSSAPARPRRPRRRRTALIASAAAIAALAAVALVARPSSSSDTDPAAPFTARARPYVYDDPCSQHFLVDRGPTRVGPPASEQDAPRWAAAYRAVSSDEQRVALTVQGTGAKTVVLEALHVRVVFRGAPLAWNDYAMGVGCGGGVESASFDVDLDAGSPMVALRGGQRAFPYKVSEPDPEVFYVTAHTKAHDVRWDLSLDWSSDGRHGTVHIDDAGRPFRTSADVGRPGYDYPLGGTAWIAREQ